MLSLKDEELIEMQQRLEKDIECRKVLNDKEITCNVPCSECDYDVDETELTEAMEYASDVLKELIVELTKDDEME